MTPVTKLIKGLSQPSSRDRTPSCTHTQMTRIFDQYCCQTCSICHTRSSLGWLYRCVQDYEGFLPASDFYDVHDTKRFDLDAQLYTLSPSIVKAADMGQYTDEQLTTLWKQKLEVRKAIRQVRPATSSAASTATSSQYSLPASTTSSSHLSSETDLGTDLTQLTDSVSPHRVALEPIKERYEGPANNPLSFTGPIATLPCNFKVCQACRPIYQQRAWQSLNDILESPYRPPPNHELTNRRVSDIRLVRQLGLRIWSEPYFQSRSTGRTSIIVDGRTQFQTIVGKLLRDQERSSPEHSVSELGEYGYQLKRVPAMHDIQSPSEGNTNSTILARRMVGSSSLLRPITCRRASGRALATESEQTLTLPQAQSDSVTMNQNNHSYPGISGLKIDTVKANADISVQEVRKTPTESIRERVSRFRDMTKLYSNTSFDHYS